MNAYIFYEVNPWNTVKGLGTGQEGKAGPGQWGDALVDGMEPSPPEGPAEQQLELHLLEHEPQETVGKSDSKHLGGLTNFWTAPLECFGNQASNSVNSRPRGSRA